MRSGQKLKNRMNREHSSQTDAANFLRNVIFAEKDLKRERGKALPNGAATTYPSSSVQSAWRGDNVFMWTDKYQNYGDTLILSKKPLTSSSIASKLQ